MSVQDKPVPDDQALLLAFGADLSKKFGAVLEGWHGHSYQHNKCVDFKFVVVESGPKNIREAKNRFASDDDYVVLIPKWKTLLLKSGKKSIAETINNASDYERIIGVVCGSNIKRTKNEITLSTCLEEIIDNLPKASSGFVNPGMFSAYYLKTRLDDDMWDSARDIMRQIKKNKPSDLYHILGWGKHIRPGKHVFTNVTLIVSSQDDLSLKVGDNPAPSSMVIDAVKQTPWVVLTNGINWRLYTSKIAAMTTDYFQVNYNPDHADSIKYLVAIFSYKAYGTDLLIEKYLYNSTMHAKKLERNLQKTITDKNGPFFNLIMGVLNHKTSKVYSRDELDAAKDAALRALYRIWFVLYAESRDLLPVKNIRYYPLSFRAIRAKLDSYDADPESTTCWDDMLNLFSGMRYGDPNHNLPPYDGEIFAENDLLDVNELKNKFVGKAFRALVEDDGEFIDYGSLGVRNIGSVYETLMDIVVRQASNDIMVYEGEDGITKIVSTKEDSNYTYKKGDLYMVKKGGLFSRKNTGSYYTPEEFVEFLVKRGLEPLLAERESAMKNAIRAYVANQSLENRNLCVDLLLNLRIIDPAMGSGHFLVESLNRLTQWATALLSKYPEHPVWVDLRADRDAALTLQQKNNIELDENLLKHETLLKRRIMKQCIFGVDLNPLAVELAKFSLWLDSFAIGVPLTYMDHHIKVGDSTIGLWLNDVDERKNQYLDTWQHKAETTSTMLSQINRNSDITVDQVHESAKIHEKCESNILPHKIVLDVLAADRMDKTIIPSNVTDKRSYAERFSLDSNKLDRDMLKVRGAVQKLSDDYHFFHWELEFMDVFNSDNNGGGGGFDLVVGNPPWDKVKIDLDEFFSQHGITVKDLRPYSIKKAYVKKILESTPAMHEQYNNYLKFVNLKRAFYKNRTNKLQNKGDADLWKVVFERSLRIVINKGCVSMLIPQQLLGSAGLTPMRKKVLSMSIRQMYVFENKEQKFFAIDSEYRFILLTLKNEPGSDEFDVGFYLHDTDTLNGVSEITKLATKSKKRIRNTSPDDLVISEIDERGDALIEKLAQHSPLHSGISDGWDVGISSGFHQASDAKLLKKTGRGWPVLEGKHTYQFNLVSTTYEYIADRTSGLRRENKRSVYVGRAKDFHDSYRLTFHDVTKPTTTRSIIAALIPPHTFHTKLYAVVLKKNGRALFGHEYDQKNSYLLGVMNSMTFDFIARPRIRLHAASIIQNLPIPRGNFEAEIAVLAARLSVGHPSFKKLALSLGVKNTSLSPKDRIHTLAKMDALVAHAYGINANDYQIVLDSFSFGDDPSLLKSNKLDLTNKHTRKDFYGEVRKLSMSYFNKISGGVI